MRRKFMLITPNNDLVFNQRVYDGDYEILKAMDEIGYGRDPFIAMKFTRFIQMCKVGQFFTIGGSTPTLVVIRLEDYPEPQPITFEEAEIAERVESDHIDKKLKEMGLIDYPDEVYDELNPSDLGIGPFGD